LSTVRAGVVIIATSVITVIIDQVIVVLCLLQTELILTDPVPITLLIAKITKPALLAKKVIPILPLLLKRLDA
jgi:hypothetical protein